MPNGWEVEMTRECRIYQRSAYGVTRIYPHPQCPNATALALLIGQTTFSEDHIRRIVALGYDVQVTPDPRAPTLKL